jgi:hypothetical protein
VSYRHPSTAEPRVVTMEEVMPGGRFARPVRRGSTLERDAGPGQLYVHELLVFLEARGFELAPRYLGRSSATLTARSATRPCLNSCAPTKRSSASPALSGPCTTPPTDSRHPPPDRATAMMSALPIPSTVSDTAIWLPGTSSSTAARLWGSLTGTQPGRPAAPGT